MKMPPPSSIGSDSFINKIPKACIKKVKMG